MSEEAPATASAPAVPNTVQAAEKAALSVQKKLNTQAMPIRQYLESTVVPLLMAALQALCKERPDNPVEFVAHYLLEHNPQSKPAAGEAPAVNAEGAAP